ISNLSAAQRSTLLAKGINLPYAGYPSNQQVRNSLRPYPQYAGTLNSTGAPLGKTWYDSIQLVATKRLSHGLTLNGNYTYAKNLDLLSSPDPYNRQLGKNLSANDIPHLFQLAADYRLPQFKSIFGQRWAGMILSSWGMGWYLQYQSGALLARPASVSAT